MSATVASQYTRHSHSHCSSRNLLNLDCSADLKSYRRDLGPGVQAKCFEKTSDTIRAQLDHHRAVLLRDRQSGHASGFPSPVPRLELPQQHAGPGSSATSPQNIGAIGNYHTASQPRPLQYLSQPHAPQQARPASRPQSPSQFPGNIGTYPARLRRALEDCAQHGYRYEPDTAWEVFVTTGGSHVDAPQGIAGAYDSLQEANMKAARCFVSELFESREGNLVYEVGNNGCLRINIRAESATAAYTVIGVRSMIFDKRGRVSRLG